MLSVQSLGQNNTTFGKGRNYAKKAEQAIRKYYQGEISKKEMDKAICQDIANAGTKHLPRIILRNTFGSLWCKMKLIFRK